MDNVIDLREGAIAEVPNPPETFYFTVKQAAEATGVHFKTIMDKLRDGKFPGAYRDGDWSTAPWMIPSNELGAAGLKPASNPIQVEEASESEVEILRRKIHTLEVEVAIYKTRSEEKDRTIDLMKPVLALMSGPTDKEPKKRFRLR